MAMGIDSSGKVITCSGDLIESPSCCDKEDGGTYEFPCCPSVSVDCESESKTASLCGYSEYTGYESSPPKKYKKQKLSGGYETYAAYACNEFCSPDHFPFGDTRETTTEYERVTEYDSNCVEQELSLTMGVLTTTHRGSGSASNCGGGTSTSTSNFSYNVTPNIINSATEAEWEAIDNDYFSSGDCAGKLSQKFERGLTFALDSPDSETDALDRATPSSGSSCSSVWQTRSTGFSFTKRTSEYTLNMSNLIDGQGYRVKPIIRRRTAVIGSEGAWEDVATGWQSFTASGSTHSIGPTALTHTQGYEYEITDAFVEAT